MGINVGNCVRDIPTTRAFGMLIGFIKIHLHNLGSLQLDLNQGQFMVKKEIRARSWACLFGNVVQMRMWTKIKAIQDLLSLKVNIELKQKSFGFLFI